MRNAISLQGGIAALVLLGCSAPLDLGDSAEGEVGVAVAALSVCDEMVPANRNIDGIPAYAQCTASNSAAIYSDDGVNTSTTQMGPEWIRTQYSGGYQCTELAHRYLYFRWDIDWVPRGNAGTWCDTQPPANVGMVQTMTPVHGDLMVLAPGSCGADASTGHVNVVDIAGATSLTVVEQNGARRGTYKPTCAKCFLHVVANDGTPSDPVTPPTGGTGGTGGAPAAGSAAPPATQPPPPAMMPPATPPMQPPATPPPSTPAPGTGVPQAGAPAPAPMTPVPVAPPAAAPAAPVGMPPIVPPVSLDRSEPAADSGCAVAGGAGASAKGASLLAPIGLALLGLARRRRRA